VESGLEVAGRYRLERLVGGGAFGEVWRAADLLRDRPVAVKFLHRGISASSPVSLSKFRQEARIAARLEHPGITGVDDFGEYDGQWFLAMEFLDGRDLASELADHPGGLPVRRVVGLAVQLADALVAAHEMGVVHRDLKPANLMVVAGDRLKVCDFGIAQMADASTTHTFAGRVGTPTYMATEQWSGDPVDHRTDLYALGGILFALLTGHPPFTSERTEGLMGQHLNARIPRTRTERPEVPAALDKLITELLAKKPAQRPDRTTDVLARLHRIQEALTPDTRPPASPLSTPPPGTLPPAATRKAATRWSSAARIPLPGVSRRALLTAAALSLTAAAVPLALLIDEPSDGGEEKPAGGIDYSRFRLRFTLPGHQTGTGTVAFSSNGAILATVNGDDTAKTWDAETGEPIAAIDGHRHVVSSVVFSPAEAILATSSQDGTAKTWDARTGELLTTFAGHQGYVGCVVFSPDGAALVTSSEDHIAKVWDAATGKLLTTLTGHQDYVNSVVFNPDGRTLATSSNDHTAKVWNTATGEIIATLIGHRHVVWAAVFNPDGTALATSSYDHTAKVWNAATGELLTTLTGHRESVNFVVFNPDGTALATSGSDGTAKVWGEGK